MQRNHFDTEHNLFRDAFAAFLDKEVVPHQEAWEEAGVVDRSVWRKAGEMGFLLPWADEEYGGAGLKDFRYEQIIESRRVSLGAHWVDTRESSLLRRLERGREVGL